MSEKMGNEAGVIRCNNPDVHTHEYREPGEGNILCFVENNRIYIQCSDHRCSQWNEITITIPGVKIDFGKASIRQKLVPKGYRFDAKNIPVVLESIV